MPAARRAVTLPAELTREQVVARSAGVAPAAFGLDAPGVVNRLPTHERVVTLTFDYVGRHGRVLDGRPG